jgi:hypothetical protein
MGSRNHPCRRRLRCLLFRVPMPSATVNVKAFLAADQSFAIFALAFFVLAFFVLAIFVLPPS